MMTELNSVCNRKLQSNFTESGVVAARFERIFSASSLVSYIQMLIKLSHTHAGLNCYLSGELPSFMDWILFAAICGA